MNEYILVIIVIYKYNILVFVANNKLAIIGGSGLYDVEFKDEGVDLNTPWENHQTRF